MGCLFITNKKTIHKRRSSDDSTVRTDTKIKRKNTTTLDYKPPTMKTSSGEYWTMPATQIHECLGCKEHLLVTNNIKRVCVIAGPYQARRNKITETTKDKNTTKNEERLNKRH